MTKRPPWVDLILIKIKSIFTSTKVAMVFTAFVVYPFSSLAVDRGLFPRQRLSSQ